MPESSTVPPSLGAETVERSRKWNGFPHVMEAAQPGHRAFNAEPKSRVFKGAIAAQVKVPLKGRFRELVLLNARAQRFQIVLALSATDHFAVTFRCQNVHAQRKLRIFRVTLHVEGLEIERIAMHDDRAIELRTDRCFFVGPKIVSEFRVVPCVAQDLDGLRVGDPREGRNNRFELRKIPF